MRLLIPGAGGASTRVFFAVPMLCLLVLSFWQAKGFTLIPTSRSTTTRRSPPRRSIARSCCARSPSASITASIVVPLAFALSYLMRFVFERRGQLILQLVLLSLFSGYLVRIYAWRTILGKQGLLNSTLEWLGIIDQPLEFLIYSNLATVITLTGLLLPLAVLPIYSSMANISRDHLEVARDLGSKRAHLVRTMLVPMALPGIRTAFAFAFLLAAGDFVTPALVGGTQGIMIGNVIADQFRGIGSNWPLGAALAFVTMVIRPRHLLPRHARDPRGDAMVSRGAAISWRAVYVAVVLLFLYAADRGDRALLLCRLAAARDARSMASRSIGTARAFSNPLMTTALRNSIILAVVSARCHRRARRRPSPSAWSSCKSARLRATPARGEPACRRSSRCSSSASRSPSSSARSGMPQGLRNAAIGHVIVCLPFVVLTMNARLETFDFTRRSRRPAISAPRPPAPSSTSPFR